jgi:hypothetical protein
VSDIPPDTTNRLEDHVMNIIATVRTCVVAAAFGAASLTLSSCGDEVRPPSQNIGGVTPEPSPREFEPACNTRAASTPCPNPSYAPNRQKIDSEPAPNRQKIDSEPAPNRQKVDSEFLPGR